MDIENDQLELIKKFRDVALEIVNENYGRIKEWASGRQEHYKGIQPILDSDEFNDDLTKYVDIQIKYEEEGIDIPFLLGYAGTEEQIGQFSFEDEIPSIEEDDFNSEEGVTIIMRIFELLDIEYGCKYCIARPSCQKLNPDIDCDKIEDIIDDNYMAPLVREILSKICEFSQIRSAMKARVKRVVT
jgi:hypothetical protein